jgi:hypothetical protein
MANLSKRANLRASDADREQIAERLRHATVEGRLLAEELEHRLGTVFAARTYGELDAVVADLPAGPADLGPRRPGLHPWLLPALALALAIPVALAIIATVLLLLTGVVAMWMVWIVIGAWFFGHRRHYRGGGTPRRTQAYGPRRPNPRAGFWL